MPDTRARSLRRFRVPVRVPSIHGAGGYARNVDTNASATPEVGDSGNPQSTPAYAGDSKERALRRASDRREPHFVRPRLDDEVPAIATFGKIDVPSDGSGHNEVTLKPCYIMKDREERATARCEQPRRAFVSPKITESRILEISHGRGSLCDRWR